MKRGAASFAGFAYGLLLTWLCLYTFSHMEWHRSRVAAPGCLDVGNCGWWEGSLILGAVFLPPLLFGVLNVTAWRRWTVRRWALYAAGLSVATVLFHLAGYAA